MHASPRISAYLAVGLQFNADDSSEEIVDLQKIATIRVQDAANEPYGGSTGAPTERRRKQPEACAEIRRRAVRGVRLLLLDIIK